MRHQVMFTFKRGCMSEVISEWDVTEALHKGGIAGRKYHDELCAFQFLSSEDGKIISRVSGMYYVGLNVLKEGDALKVVFPDGTTRDLREQDNIISPKRVN